MQVFLHIDGSKNSSRIKIIVKEYHDLSWLNISPFFPTRNSILPFHFAILSKSAHLISMASGL